MGPVLRRFGAVAAVLCLAVGFLVIPASAGGFSPPAISVEKGLDCFVEDGLGGVSGEQFTTDSQAVAIKGFGPDVKLAFLRCTFALSSSDAPPLGGNDSGFLCGIGTPYGTFLTSNSSFVVIPGFVTGQATGVLTCIMSNFGVSSASAVPSAGMIP